MTDLTDQLDAIEARSAGLTDLCAEHLRQSIRHVQRNCDIDCNVHEDETTWDDCRQPGRYDGDRMAAVLADVTFLLDLARKQQAALAEVEEWLKILDVVEEADPTTPTNRNVSAAGVASAIRAAVKTALEAKP